MNEKSFLNNIDDETLAEMIDKTLNYKKAAKNRNIKATLFKIIPAVAAVVLMIGLINILPAMLNNMEVSPDNQPGSEINIDDAAENPKIQIAKHSYTYDELLNEIYDKAKLVQKTYKDISDISVDLTNHDIYIIRGDGNLITVKYYEWTQDEYDLSDDNGTLTLKYMDSDKYCYIDENGNEIYEWVNAILQKSGRNVNPDNPDTDIRAISITVPKNTTLESLNINGTNGDINITGCNIKIIDVNTVNGDILINSYDCKDGQNYNANTVNGNINFDYCGNLEFITASTVNGDIFVSNSDIQQATINGEIYNNVKNGTYSRNDINNSTEFNYWFYDGAKVTAFDSYTTKNTTSGDRNGYIIFSTTECIIQFTNGVIAEAPVHTKVEIRNGSIFTAAIGDGEATITQPDGTSTTVPSGTVLDSEGNVIK